MISKPYKSASKPSFGHFLLAIQTVRAVDLAAFQRIDHEAREIARVLNGHSLVPKSLLNELRVATTWGDGQ
jgi:hypothetical protein